MLPIAFVCVPVLGILVAGLLGDRRYLGQLRDLRQTPPTRPAAIPVARPEPGVPARPAA